MLLVQGLHFEKQGPKSYPEMSVPLQQGFSVHLPRVQHSCGSPEDSVWWIQLGQGFVSKGRSLCQMADCVLKVWNSDIINAIILKILEKLTHLALATSNQRCQVIDSNLTPNLITGELKIISTLYLWSTLFFHKAPSTVPPPSPGEGRVEGKL